MRMSAHFWNSSKSVTKVLVLTTSAQVAPAALRHRSRFWNVCSRNRAAASAYLLVLISKDGDHRSLPPGRYVCELIKADNGQWRFSRRIVFHDHDYTLDGIGR
jgi:hypothetical protein